MIKADDQEVNPGGAALLAIHGEIACITLNCPDKRNAFSDELREALAAHLRVAINAAEVRAIVIAANGPVFCAGGDISGMKTGNLLHYRQRMRAYHDIVRWIVEGPKPVIAAVQGGAFGAGFSLAMACDYVVATPDAKFCSAFARLNLMPDMGLMHTLVRRVGSWQARRMITTSKLLEASDALRYGVVDELVEPARLIEAAMLSARQHAALAPGAFALVKSAFASGATDSLDEVLRLETEGQAALRGTLEHHEAVAAFFNKQTSRKQSQAEHIFKTIPDAP